METGIPREMTLRKLKSTMNLSTFPFHRRKFTRTEFSRSEKIATTFRQKKTTATLSCKTATAFKTTKTTPMSFVQIAASLQPSVTSFQQNARTVLTENASNASKTLLASALVWSAVKQATIQATKTTAQSATTRMRQKP
jgi:hypothetical protein